MPNISQSESVVELAELASYVHGDGTPIPTYDSNGTQVAAFRELAQDEESDDSGMVADVFQDVRSNDVVVVFQGTTFNDDAVSHGQKVQDAYIALGANASSSEFPIFDEEQAFLGRLFDKLADDPTICPSGSLSDINGKVTFAGHSLGAAEATYAEAYTEAVSKAVTGSFAVGFDTPSLPQSLLDRLGSGYSLQNANVINIDGSADVVPGGTAYIGNPVIGSTKYVDTPDVFNQFSSSPIDPTEFVSALANTPIFTRLTTFLGGPILVSINVNGLSSIVSKVWDAHNLGALTTLLSSQQQAFDDTSSGAVFTASNVTSTTTTPIAVDMENAAAQLGGRTALIQSLGAIYAHSGLGGPSPDASAEATASAILSGGSAAPFDSTADVSVGTANELAVLSAVTEIATAAFPEIASQILSSSSLDSFIGGIQVVDASGNDPQGGIVFNNFGYTDSVYANGPVHPSSDPLTLPGSGGFAVTEQNFYRPDGSLSDSAASHFQFAVEVGATGYFEANAGYSSDYEDEAGATNNSPQGLGDFDVASAHIEGSIDLSTGNIKELDIYPVSRGPTVDVSNPAVSDPNGYDYVFATNGSYEIKTYGTDDGQYQEVNDRHYDPSGNLIPNTNPAYPDNVSNSYSFSKGQGSETIKDIDVAGSPNYDVLTLNGISQPDVSGWIGTNTELSAAGPNDLTLRIEDTGELITLTDQMEAGTTDGVEEIDFGGDGTKLYAADIANWVASHQGIIAGTSGNDTLTGWVGGTILQAGAGNDTLSADLNMGSSPHTTTFIGGAGNDTMNGGVGPDIYEYTSGDGSDVINEGSTAQSLKNDTLWLTNLGLPQVSVAQSGSDMVLTDKTTGSTITLKNEYTADGNGGHEGIETFQFGSTSYTRMEFGNMVGADSVGSSITGTSGNDTLNGTAQSDHISGGAGNDSIYGGGGDDVIRGGAGNDLLTGGPNGSPISDNDTYLFSVGDGNDTVYDRYNDGPAPDFNGLNGDTITFDNLTSSTAVKSGNVTFTQTYYDMENGSNVNALVIHYGSADTITLPWWIDETGATAIATDTIKFTDGSTMSILGPNGAVTQTLTQHLASDDDLDGTSGNDFIDGGAGNDVIFGEAGNDVIHGGINNDGLYGGAGNDTYLFQPGDGQDRVGDPSNLAGNGGSGGDIIDFATSATAAPNISSQGVKFFQSEATADSKWSVGVAYGTSYADVVRLENWVEEAGVSNQTLNDTIQFSDKTMTAAQAVEASQHATTVNGTAYDTIYAMFNGWAAGANDMFADANADHFMFNAGFSQAEVEGSKTGASGGAHDFIDFVDSNYKSFSDLQAAGAISQSGTDTLITYDAADVITLKGVMASSLSSADFAFL